tara:strand:+ start:1679 stop:2404 length:726 start_codon:yes stop_codon:yes gene_type:complete
MRSLGRRIVPAPRLDPSPGANVCNAKVNGLRRVWTPGSKHVPWTKEEERKLCRNMASCDEDSLVPRRGRPPARQRRVTDWAKVSKGIARTPKQCREHWYRKLAPTLNHATFTAEEDVWLLQLVAKHGHRWTRIAQYMHGRSDVMLRRRAGELRKRAVAPEPPELPEVPEAPVENDAAELFATLLGDAAVPELPTDVADAIALLEASAPCGGITFRTVATVQRPQCKKVRKRILRSWPWRTL